MTLDISKAFDTLERKTLLDLITKQAHTPLKDFLKIILDTYKKINLNIDNEIIHPETGVPQGSVFVKIHFLIYINPVLTEIQNKYPNSQIQAFVDDIIIISKREVELNQVFGDTRKLIDKLKFKLNLNKSKSIAQPYSKPIIDETTQYQIHPTAEEIYLGQKIDNQGNKTNIINTFDYNSITKLVGTAAYNISRRAKVNPFKTSIYLNESINSFKRVIFFS